MLTPHELGELTTEVVRHYQRYHPRSRPGPKERGKIHARLNEGWTVGDLKQALDAGHRSPWHLGQNPRGRRYLGIVTLLRDSSQVQRFLEEADQPDPGPRLNEQNCRGEQAAQRWLQRTMARQKRRGERRLEG